MKSKIIAIIILGSICLVLSLLYSFGIGMSSNRSLTEEEAIRYENRKQYTSLTIPAEKASYALGMSQMTLNKYLDGKDKKSLATIYSVVSKPADSYYYWGQSISYSILNNATMMKEPLDPECFIAGFIQTIKKNVLVPELSGKKGSDYIMSKYSASNTEK